MNIEERSWPAYFLLVTAFIFFAWRSWRTWPDILVDFGHELYIPWRLSEGEALYSDIPFTMGPLSQYTNALLFRLFGVSLETIVAANLTILAAIVVMVFWLLRRCGTLWSATFATLFFLSVFAFGQYILIGNYNYVCPYRHEITHGLALGLAELVCLVRFSETRRPAWLNLAGFCLGFVWLTKMEIAIPAISAALVAITLTSRPRASSSTLPVNLTGRESCLGRSIDIRVFATFITRLLISATIPVAIAFITLAASLNRKHALEAVFGNFWLSVTPSLTVNNGFYRSVSGMDTTYLNAQKMLLVSLCLAAAIGFVAVLDRMMSHLIRSHLLASVIGIVTGVMTAACVKPDEFFMLPNALPVVLPIIIGISLIQCWRNPSINRSTATLVISIFAFLLLPKIILNVRWVHYGFALAMPGTLLLVHILVWAIPNWLRTQHAAGRLFRAVAVGLLSGCAFVQFVFWNRIDEHKIQRVGTRRDTFYADPINDDRVEVTIKTLDFLRDRMKPNETLCVIPDGSSINYLLRKRNPTGILMFNPWELEVNGGEEHVRDRLDRMAPDYIVYLTMEMIVFGRGEFGNRLYGKKLLEFIESNYQLIDTNSRVSPNGNPVFQAKIYKRQPPNG